MNPYKIYKAQVTKVSIPDNRGETQRKIYVSPYPPDGSGSWQRPANPPNVFPTNTLGSGLISYPEIGQECIVAEWKGERQILAYTTPGNVSPYGTMVPDDLQEGSIRFGIKGLHEALIKMTREGQVTIYSQTFAQMGVDGSSSTVFSKAKKHSKTFAGGLEYNTYDEETKATPSIAMYTHKKFNPVFSDHLLGIEEVTGDPVPDTSYRYEDKAIIRSGYIGDGRHPWELQTRQNIKAFAAQDKNVVTQLRMGYQKPHSRFNGEQDHPNGTMIELSAKKNIPGDVGVFKFRYGRRDRDIKKLGSNRHSTDKGEIFSLYAYEGLNGNKPFGSTIKDPMGEGRGWGLDYTTKADQVYIYSVGRQKDTNQSFERKWLKDEKYDFTYLSLIGGETVIDTRINHKGVFSYHKQIEKDKGYESYVFEDFTVINNFEKGWSANYMEDGDMDYISIKKDKINLKNNSESSIELDGGGITLKNKSGDQIKAEGGKITISTDGVKLEITKTSFKVNGRSLVFEDVLKILTTPPLILTTGSPGAVSPINPTIATQLKLPTNIT